MELRTLTIDCICQVFIFVDILLWSAVVGRDYYDESLSKQNTLWNSFDAGVKQSGNDQYQDEDMDYKDDSNLMHSAGDNYNHLSCSTLSSPAQRRRNHYHEGIRLKPTATFPQHKNNRFKDTNIKVWFLWFGFFVITYFVASREIKNSFSSEEGSLWRWWRKLV